MATCANPACTTPEFTPGPRRGKPQTFCRPACQIKHANSRRSSTRAGRSGRGSEAPRTPKSVAESPQSPSNLSTPPQVPVRCSQAVRATTAKLFGSWYVRVNGQLALGPLDKSRAQDHADRMNVRSTDKVAP